MRTAPTMRRLVERFVIPEWGDRSIGELKRSDVDDAARRGAGDGGARRRTPPDGGRVMADKLFTLLSSMMHWWAGRSDDFVPAHRQEAAPRRAHATRRARACSTMLRIAAEDWRELKALWEVTATPTPFNGLVRMLLLDRAAARQGAHA